VLSDLFETHPKLKVILGHLGETLPFLSWRVDSALRRPGGKQLDFRGIFSRNFWITTSGFFADAPLQCCMTEMGVDHILFAVDWPFVNDNKPGVDWLFRTPLSDDDRAKIASGNAKRLLRL
jgi:2,3-dihydroxybenzoate decarboxylase